MTKIECLIGNELNEVVNKLRKQAGQTRAEFNRQALNHYVDNQLTIKPQFESKLKEFLKQ